MASARRPYPTDLTDDEWELLARSSRLPSRAAARPSMTAGSWSTPWPTGYEPAVPGGCCPMTCHPGRPSTTTSAAGDSRSCGSRSTECFMSRNGSAKAGRPPPAQPSWTARASRPPNGGAPWLRRRQEGQRPQAPPASRHSRPGLQGPGDRGRRWRPRRCCGVARAAGSPAVPSATTRLG
jgi:hypothetical protein